MSEIGQIIIESPKISSILNSELLQSAEADCEQLRAEAEAAESGNGCCVCVEAKLFESGGVRD